MTGWTRHQFYAQSQTLASTKDVHQLFLSLKGLSCFSWKPLSLVLLLPISDWRVRRPNEQKDPAAADLTDLNGYGLVENEGTLEVTHIQSDLQ